MSLLRFFHKAASQQTAGPGNRGSTGRDAISALPFQVMISVRVRGDSRARANACMMWACVTPLSLKNGKSKNTGNEI